MNVHSSFKMGANISDLKKVSRISYKRILPDTIVNKSKTGWTAPINLWRSQFKKDCKDINRLANNITKTQNLPDDKRWAPILQLFTWQQIFQMNFDL
jgi:asparagine synthetase B (glutamine-hydrolysing)